MKPSEKSRRRLASPRLPKSSATLRSQPVRVDALERRQLLARPIKNALFDFVYDQSTLLTGFDARLTATSSLLQLQDTADNSVLAELPLALFSGNVSIVGSGGDDALTIALPDELVVKNVTYTGGPGSDSASVVGKLNTAGGSVSLTAETITMAGAQIDTRSSIGSVAIANAGDVTLTGKSISLTANTQINAQVSPGTQFKSGTVTVTTSDLPTAAESIFGDLLSPILVTDRQASINLSGSRILGGDVSITASAKTQTRWDDLKGFAESISSTLLTTLGQLADVAISLATPLSGQVKVQKATTSVTLDSTTVTADGALTVLAASSSDASFEAVAVNSRVPVNGSPAPFLINVGYGETLSKADVNLTGNTSLTAGGDVKVRSNIETSNDVSTKGSANAASSSGDDVEFAVSLAIALSDQQASLTTGANTSITSNNGNIDLAAGHVDDDDESESSVSAEAEAIVFRDGIAGLAVGVSIDKANVVTEINGQVTALNPRSGPQYSFLPGTAVSTADGWITLTDIKSADKISRGSELVYDRAGNAAIAGLEDGETYYVNEVQNLDEDGVPTSKFTGTQRIKLARSTTLNLDNADVSPTATQSLSRLRVSTLPSSDVLSEANTNDLLLRLNGYETGDVITYRGPSGALTEKNITGTFTRSSAGDRITRTDAGPTFESLTLYVGQTIKISAAGDNDGDTFTIAGFADDGKTIVLAEANAVTAGTFSGFNISTLPDEPTGIGNLTQGTDYTVVRLANGQLKLRDPANPGLFVKFDDSQGGTGAGTGIQGFTSYDDAATFMPANAVDSDRDTITLPAHGLSTGDVVIYRTDPTSKFNRKVFAFGSLTDTTPEQIGTVTLPDAPVSGLSNAFLYYVTVVDGNTIRLSESAVAARLAVPVTLGSTPAGTHALQRPGEAKGISIRSKLSASNSGSAGSALSDAEQEGAEILLGLETGGDSLVAGLLAGPDFISKLRTAADDKKDQKPNNAPTLAQDPVDTGVPVEFAGTASVVVYKHTVETRIGSTAVIKSGKDLSITSEIEEDVGSSANSQATRAGKDGADTSNQQTPNNNPNVNQPREDVELSIAFSLLINSNNARTYVRSGAQLDARGQTDVTSEVSYPLKVENPANISNPAYYIREEDAGLDAFELFTDGSLGLSSNFYNTNVGALGGDPGDNAADKFVLGLALDLVFFNDESIARVESGARINQDTNYQTTQQAVSVTADTESEMVHVGQMSALNLNLNTLYSNVQTGRTEGFSPAQLREFVNPFGLSGQNAIGPIVLLTVANHKTIAEVEGAALIRTGSAGEGLRVAATEDIWSLSLAQTGAQASEFGLTASVTVGIFDTTTHAIIGRGAVITGGAVSVLADDTIDRYGITGGWVLGNATGVGISVSVNTVNRNTQAYLGSDTPNSAGQRDAGVTSTGDVTVSAATHGDLFALALAAAVITDPSNEPAPANPPPPTTPGDPVGGTRIAVGASVALNEGTSVVKAFIDDPLVNTTGTLAVDAKTDVTARTIVIGGAAAVGGGDTSIAGAGAFAVNSLNDNQVYAFIRDSRIQADILKVTAEDASTIYTDGGGVAVAVSLGSENPNNVSVGIGVAVNAINSDVRAFVDRISHTAPGAVAGDYEVSATFKPTIDALTIGGAGAVSSGASGNSLNIAGAGAGAKNAINGAARAYVINTSGFRPGSLRVTAKDESKIVSDAGAFALSLSLSAGGSFTNLSFSVSAAVNEVTSITEAYLDNVTFELADNSAVTVLAKSDATIDSLTIGGSLGSGSFSGAGSGNTVNATTKAYADTVKFNTPGSSLSVRATNTSDITADAGGFAIAANLSAPGSGGGGAVSTGSLGVGASLNTITARTRAYTIDVQGTGINTYAVNADSTATIKSLAMGGAGAASADDGSTFTFAGAGSGAGNSIDSIVEAYARNEDLALPTSGQLVSAGTLSVTAVDRSTIEANAGAVAFAVGISQGSANINAAVGASVAVNSIAADVSAHLDDMSLNASASVDVIASSDSSIRALTIAGAGALGISPSGSPSLGVNVAGAGVLSFNRIGRDDTGGAARNATRAYISSGRVISGGSLKVAADDDSTINAVAVGGSIAVTVGSGGSVALGFADAKNVVNADVLSYIDDSAHVTGGEPIQLSSTALTVIDTKSVAVAASLTISSGNSPVTLSGSGAGAGSTNTITRTIASDLKDGADTSAISLNAVDRSSIKADSGGGSLAVSASPRGLSGAFAVSAGIATNTVRNTIRAQVSGAGTTVIGGNLSVSSLADTTIDALAVSVSAAVAVAPPTGGFSLALAGAGSNATNTVDNTVTANVSGGASVQNAPTTLISATDTAAITAVVPSVAISVSVTGVGFAVGASVAHNLIGTDTTAFIDGAGVTGGNAVSIKSTSDQTISATATAAAVSIAIGGAVVGSDAKSDITGDTLAYIGDNTTVSSTGAMEVNATSDADITTTGSGGSGGLVGVSVFVANSAVGSTADRRLTSATIGSGATINANSLSVIADSDTSIDTKLLSVSLGAIGGAGANSTSSSYADTLVSIGATGASTITLTGGDLTLNATSSQLAVVTNDAGAGGLGAIASTTGTSRAEGKTDVRLGESTAISGVGSATVNATVLNGQARTKLLAGSGGLVSIGNTRAEAISKTPTTITIGRGAQITATNDIVILAQGAGEADASAESSGGGAVQVGVGYATTTAEPKAQVSIGDAATLTAGRDLYVNSILFRVAAPVGQSIISSVDQNADTIGISFPLNTGDVVVYRAPEGGSVIGGLVNGRSYNVLVQQPNSSIKLGNSVTPATVDALSDVITFAQPHNFQPGDAVRLDFSGTLSPIEPWQLQLPSSDPQYVSLSQRFFVRGVPLGGSATAFDPQRLRLARTASAATATEASLLRDTSVVTGNRLTGAPGAFTNGQAVTYRAPARQSFATEQVDVDIVDKVYRDANGRSQTTRDVRRDSAGNSQLVINANNIFLPGHGFSTGDAVTYRTTGTPLGSLVNGRTYYVIRVNSEQIRLASSYLQAVGLAADDRGTSSTNDDIAAIPVTPIAINRAGNASGLHSLSREISGLQDDRTYYVTNAAGDGSFQLAATRGGTPIAVSVTESVVIRQANGQIARTLTPTTRGGTHRVGTLGIDLQSDFNAAALVIDLTSGLPTGEHKLESTGGSLLAGQVQERDGQTTSRAVGGSGGGIDVNVPTAIVNASPSATIDIGTATGTTNATLTAGRILGLFVNGSTSFSATADTSGGGIVTIGEAHADALLNSANFAVNVLRGTLQGTSSVSVRAESQHQTVATARSAGGGAFGVKVAETTSKLTSDTRVNLGSSTVISSSGPVAVVANTFSTANSSAETFNIAIGSFTDSDNTNDDRGVTLNSPVTIDVQPGASITGDTVAIQSQVQAINVKARANAQSYSPIFIGVATAFADASANVTADARVNIPASSNPADRQTKITGHSGVDIVARVQPPTVVRDDYALAIALIPPQGSRELGATNTSATVNAGDGVTVIAGTRSTVSPLESRPSVPNLALFVDADTAINWDADVEIRGNASRQLTVDAAGNITQRDGITATANAFEVIVSDIVATPGQALFEGDGAVNGSRGRFTFNDSLSFVNIQVAQQILVVNNIRMQSDPATLSTQPAVTIDVPTNSLEFDVTQNRSAGSVSLTATGAGADIRLRGTIDNPLGTVSIITPGGITSFNYAQRQGVIRASAIALSAGTYIGSTFPNDIDRLSIDIVQGTSSAITPNSLVADLGSRIAASAGGNMYVGLQAIFRQGATSRVSTLSSSEFIAGGRADILLRDGLDQSTVVTPVQSGIIVAETARVTVPNPAPSPTTPAGSPRTTVVTDHFRVSTAAATPLPNALFATGGTPVGLLYNLGSVTANGISINRESTDANGPFIDVQSDVLVTGFGSTVNARTNGNIALTSFDSLPVGRIESQFKNVTLTSTGGDIYEPTQDADADVLGLVLNLSAARSIGSFGPDPSALTNMLEVDAYDVQSPYATSPVRLNANASWYVGLAQVGGTLRVGRIAATSTTPAGLVRIQSPLGVRAEQPVAGVADIRAFSIEFSDTFGVTSSSAEGMLLIDTAANGTLTVERSTVNLREITGSLRLSSLGDGVIATTDTSAPGEDILVPQRLIAINSLELLPGDGFLMASGAGYSGRWTVRGDQPANDADPGVGAIFQVFGTSLNLGNSATLIGGNDNDRFNLSLSPFFRFDINGSNPQPPTFPGDSLSYTYAAPFVGSVAVDFPSAPGDGVIVNDFGQTLVNYVSIETIDEAGVNQAPVNRVPASVSVLSSSTGSARFFPSLGTGISVSDPDATSNFNQFSITLAASSGAVNFPNVVGLTPPGVTLETTPAGLRYTGTLAALNAMLASGLVINNLTVGVHTLTITSNDGGSSTGSGLGTPLTDTDVIQITVFPGTPVNQPPVNRLPGPFAVLPRTGITFSRANGNAFFVEDPDAGNGGFSTELTVSVGTLSLANAVGVSVGGNGTQSLLLSGQMLGVNETLRNGLIWTPPAGFDTSGVNSVSITMLSNDLGNTGSGGPKTDADTLTLNFQPYALNQAPVNVLPSTFTTAQSSVVFSAATGGFFTITDADAGNTTNFQVQLRTSRQGTLELVNTPADIASRVTVQQLDGAYALQLTGTLSDINAVLGYGLRFTAAQPLLLPPGSSGSVQYGIEITSNDNGATGSDGPKSDTDTYRFTRVQSFNQAPVNLVPSATTGASPIIFRQADGNAFNVSDLDAGTSNLTVTLTPSAGTLRLSGTGSITPTGSGTTASPLVLTGSQTAINQLLNLGLIYEAPVGTNATITITTNDNGNSGFGGPLSDTDVVNVSVVANPNRAPVNTLPGSFITDRSRVTFSAFDGNALSVLDPDAGFSTISVSLSVSAGTLLANGTPGVSISGNGSASSPLTLVGIQTFINAALAAGLVYNRPANAPSQVTLTMVSNDNGNTGSGGPRTDTDVMTMTFTASVNEAPINIVPPPITVTGPTVLFSAATGNAFRVTDVDAGNAANFSVALSASAGTLTVSQNSLVQVEGNGTPGNPLRLTGTIADINSTLAAGLTLNATGVSVPSDITLTMVSNDAGNSGAGGPKLDTDTTSVLLRTTAVNRPPVNQLPPPVVTNTRPVILSAANGNALSVSDPDIGNGLMDVRFFVTSGITATLVDSTGVSVIGPGGNGSPLVLQGTLAAINAALAAGLQLSGTFFSGSLTMISSDLQLSDTDVLPITVIPTASLNKAPVNRLPGSPTVSSSAFPFSGGSTISVTDEDAGNAANFSVSVRVADGVLSTSPIAGVTATGNGSGTTPLVLVGTLANLNTALATLVFSPITGFTGQTLLTITSNDNGNTGGGGPLTDTDTLSINVAGVAAAAPRVLGVYVDSSAWTTGFRDFADGGFDDGSALGYRIPNGQRQLETIPWVNVDRIRVAFSADVGSSLGIDDFRLTPAPGFQSAGVLGTATPVITAVQWDAATLTAVLTVSRIGSAALDLQVLAAGVSSVVGGSLDGEWVNSVSIESGNGTAGGDFSFRLLVLPGDAWDQSRQLALRIVNSNDALVVRQRQNGIAIAGLGVANYDLRADLDGDGRINSNDSLLVRDQQNAFVRPLARTPGGLILNPDQPGRTPTVGELVLQPKPLD